MVAAHHAHHAQRVICTHLMLTPTSSLPLPAVPLCMCRHGNAAEMPCGCDCTHWRCWWLPFHLLFLLLLLFLLHLSIVASSGVWVCALVEREKGCVFHTATPPASCQQLQAGGCLFVLVAEGVEGVSRSQAARVAAPPPPPPHAMLCCLLVTAWHVLLTPSRIRTNVFATWARHRPQSGRSRQVCCVLCVQLPAVVGAVTCTV